jgi:hypothetical protein
MNTLYKKAIAVLRMDYIPQDYAERKAIFENLEEIESIYNKVILDKGANDEDHCTCVPFLRIEIARLTDEAKKASEYKAEMEAYRQSYENLSVFYKQLFMANQKLAQTYNK